MKIFVHGSDQNGWAIDQNRINLISALNRQNNIVTTNPVFADIVHNVLWYKILSSDFSTRIIRFHPRILVTASNFIDPDNPDYSMKKEFQYVAKIAKGWIAFSTKQKKILDDFGLLCVQMPNYVDHSIFHPPEKPCFKNQLYAKYGIPEEVTRGRIVIGSFQRDSLGSDLTRPKWQKNPDYLIEMLEHIDKEKYVLLLAGPRRHYIISQCKKRKIPYWYIGKETETDDLELNNIPISCMGELYWICDVYVITSSSEGGPQAVMEAALTKTPIFSTDVGIARDFLPDEQIFETLQDFYENLNSFICDPECRILLQNKALTTYENTLKILNYDSMDQQLKKIYEKILG
jgi:glycosyltransferase involved in cell wall biosynthesis